MNEMMAQAVDYWRQVNQDTRKWARLDAIAEFGVVYVEVGNKLISGRKLRKYITRIYRDGAYCDHHHV